MAAELLKKTVRISTGHLKCSGHSLLFLPGGEEGGRLGWTSPKTEGHRSCSMIPDGLVGGLVGPPPRREGLRALALCELCGVCDPGGVREPLCAVPPPPPAAAAAAAAASTHGEAMTPRC